MTARIGVQLYTLRDVDLPYALERVAGLGYLGVELYGPFSPDAARIAADLGLVLSSAHVPFPAGPHARRILDEQATLGVDTVAWSLEPEEFSSVDAISRGVERINEGAANARAYGITVAYHNHDMEFRNVHDGRCAYDVLLDLVEPDVLVELDLYWTAVGGADPSAVLRQLGERVRFVHVKDGPALSRDDVMVAVGDGSLDIPAALTANPSVAWHLVELDRFAGDIFDALRDSYTYLVGRRLSHGRKASRQAAADVRRGPLRASGLNPPIS